MGSVGIERSLCGGAVIRLLLSDQPIGPEICDLNGKPVSAGMEQFRDVGAEG